jgi:hypothetical protein
MLAASSTTLAADQASNSQQQDDSDQRMVAEHGGEEPHRENALPMYRMALEECRNAFADLMAQPEKIRRNVGAVLGFAAIAVSIFGFAAGRPASILGWVCQLGAFLGLLGLIGCTVYVTLPWKLIPSVTADKIVAWGDAGDTEAEAVRNLALGIEENYEKNKAIIDRLFRAQIDAAGFFGLTVLALAIRVLGA